MSPSADTLRSPKPRSADLDFCKGVLITLVVMFHIRFVGTTAPALHDVASEFVYSFHIPAFLLLSGLFLRPRPAGEALWGLWRRILVPYLVFEPIYLMALYASARAGWPTSVHLDALTPLKLIYMTLADPEGAFWYLHTLGILGVVWIVSSAIWGNRDVAALVTCGLAAWALSWFIPGLLFANVVFLLAGLWMRLQKSQIPISMLLAAPVVVLVCAIGPH